MRRRRLAFQASRKI